MPLYAFVPATDPSNILYCGTGRTIALHYGRIFRTKVLSAWRWRRKGLLEPGVRDHVGVGHKHALAFGAGKERSVLKIKLGVS